MTVASPWMTDCRAVDACLACGSRDLAGVLDLGAQPLANNLVPPSQAMTPTPAFPSASNCVAPAPSYS